MFSRVEGDTELIKLQTYYNSNAKNYHDILDDKTNGDRDTQWCFLQNVMLGLLTNFLLSIK